MLAGAPKTRIKPDFVSASLLVPSEAVSWTSYIPGVSNVMEGFAELDEVPLANDQPVEGVMTQLQFATAL